MLEAYSINQTISATNGIIPFGSVSIEKGCTARLADTNTIELNKCGVYEIIFEGEYLASTAGTINVGMTKNGVDQPQAQRTVTGATTTESKSVSISTLVKVRDNNSCRCCDAPTLIQFINKGVAVVGDTNVVVTKLC